MCTVSMIADHYRDKFQGRGWMQQLPISQQQGIHHYYTNVTRFEFDALKREVEDMKALLARAKEYDERNGEPDCEMAEKVDLLKKVAALVGVSLEDVFGKPAE